jgi:hypothetical protein
VYDTLDDLCERFQRVCLLGLISVPVVDALNALNGMTKDALANV